MSENCLTGSVASEPMSTLRDMAPDRLLADRKMFLVSRNSSQIQSLINSKSAFGSGFGLSRDDLYTVLLNLGFTIDGFKLTTVKSSDSDYS